MRLSTRRRKYATAFWQGDRIVVVLPARLPRAQRDITVDRLVQRVLRHRPHIAASDEILAARAAELGDRYLDGIRASSVRWSSQQRHRWGSCSLDSRQVRISELLRPVPGWVVDAVLVHELAHLIEHGHGSRFAALIARYERTVEADAFLAGYALGLDQARRADSDEALDDCLHADPGPHPDIGVLPAPHGGPDVDLHPRRDGEPDVDLRPEPHGAPDVDLRPHSDPLCGQDGRRPHPAILPVVAIDDRASREEPEDPISSQTAPVAVPVPLF